MNMAPSIHLQLLSVAFCYISYSNAFLITVRANAAVLSRSEHSHYLSSSKVTALLAEMQQLDDGNMNSLLFRPPRSLPVLVDAYTAYCGPCKLIEPLIHATAIKYKDKLSVLKYDVDGPNNKNLKVEMLLQGVMISGLPTLILYHDGKPICKPRSGVVTETELEEWLDENLFSKQNKVSIESRIDEDDKVKVNRGFVSFASQFGRDDYAL